MSSNKHFRDIYPFNFLLYLFSSGQLGNSHSQILRMAVGAATLLFATQNTQHELAETQLEQRDESVAIHLPSLPLC